MRYSFLAVLIFTAPVFAASKVAVYDPPLAMVVKSTVVDVRAEPRSRALVYKYDPLQETQIEQGEPVLVYEQRGSWARIEASDQPEYTHNDRWQGYPGWIKYAALTSDRSKLKNLDGPAIPEKELRPLVLEQAARHLGSPYLWGGRSLHDPQRKDVLTGVDCSGLINWSFRQLGCRVPRDAHEQFMQARPVNPKEMKPGDLIFLAKTDKPDNVVHVAFHYDDETLLEAPQSGEQVRKISYQQRFGKTRAEMKSGDVIGDRIILFGTLFTEALWRN